MKAILTGGTGFIGRQVVAELLNAGTDVTILTSTPPKNCPVCRIFLC